MRVPETVCDAPLASASRASAAVAGSASKAEPRGVAPETPEARGVVDEALLVQHPQEARVEVLVGVRRRAHLALRQRDRDRVDGEVAAQEVFGKRRRLHFGKRARVGIALAPGHRHVDARAIERRGRRSEAVVHDLLAAERVEQRLDLPLDDDVELARRDAAQEVAHGSADQMHGPRVDARGGHRQELFAARLLAERVKYGGRQRPPPPGTA